MKQPATIRKSWFTAPILLVLVPVLAFTIMLCQQIRQKSLDYALMKAVKHLDAPAVTRLLKQGANANAKDTRRMRQQPLTLTQMLDRLVAQLQHRATDESPDPGDPVLLALFEDGFASRADTNTADNIAVSLIERGADYRVNWAGEEKMIHLASERGLHRTLLLLASLGDGLEQRDNLGRTPLLCAIVGDNPEDVMTLLEHGANANAVDNNGSSALCYANFSRDPVPINKEIIRLLKRHGARLNSHDREKLGL